MYNALIRKDFNSIWGSVSLHKQMFFLIRVVSAFITNWGFFLGLLCPIFNWLINSHSILEQRIFPPIFYINLQFNSRFLQCVTMCDIWHIPWNIWRRCTACIHFTTNQNRERILKGFFSFNLCLSLDTVCPKNLVGHKMHFMTKISCAQTVENIMRSCACFSTALHCPIVHILSEPCLRWSLIMTLGEFSCSKDRNYDIKIS